ncbi:hypothetical protein CSKR_201215 [Clonorchis sinensis]|uniref:Uncharacterized protein n=1 Tax=Clonorchis sinensis TaxID=79923 RepID=A0A8T1MMZ2_CLOSI|nr:hypothetical protein CSKR_201215 [Clonorchis sinensis]
MEHGCNLRNSPSVWSGKISPTVKKDESDSRQRAQTTNTGRQLTSELVNWDKMQPFKILMYFKSLAIHYGPPNWTLKSNLAHCDLMLSRPTHPWRYSGL